MATCPNKSLAEWKQLVADKGEATAYYLWYKNDGDISRFVSPGAVRPLTGNEDLYKRFNLLNKEGKVKTFPYKTVAAINKVNKFVATLNNSKSFTFKVQLTPSGHKIFIYNKALASPATTQGARGRMDLELESKYFPTPTVSSSSILEKIANSVHPLNKLAGKLLEYARINDVNVTLVEDLTTDIGASAGAYFPGTNTIEINKNARFKGLGAEPTLIHEILHALTSDVLTRDTANNAEFAKLFNHARKFITPFDVSTREGEYALSDLDEFMAGIFTDASFIKKLTEIPAMEGKKYDNFFEELYHYILSLFKINKEDQSLYDQAFAVASSVINDARSFAEAQSYTEEMANEAQLEMNESDVVSVMKDFLNRIGVDLQSVDSIIIDGVKQDANGAALIAQKLVQIVNGKEDLALAEEAMHFAVDIIQQRDPKLFNKLLKEINDYQILKDVFREYSNNPAYRTADGKPDILKLKKEAIGKLLSQTVTNKINDRNELTESPSKSLSLLEQVMDFLRNLFNTSGFDEAAMSVVNGDFKGSVEDLRASLPSIYYQQDVKNAVDSAFDTALEIHRDTELILATPTKKRHYKYKGTEVGSSVTELIKGGKEFNRTPEEKAQDTDKMLWGSEGHQYIEDYIKNNLIDEDGYILDEFLDNPVETHLAGSVQDVLAKFAQDLVLSYKMADMARTDGAKTRIMVEGRVVNTKAKGMVASAIDFRAFVPDDKVGVVIDTLDWKFVNINKSKDEDIPFQKRKEWNEQMNEYVKMYTTPLFGLKQENVGKARMVPISANYIYNDPKNKKSSRLYLSSIKVGNVDNALEDDIYVLPVPIESESTGNTKIDELLTALRKQYDKLYIASPIGNKQQIQKNIQLNQLSMAIRELHVKLDFTRLADVGASYISDVASVLKSFEDIDYDNLSQEEINDKMAQLIDFEKSIDKFTRLDDIFLSKFQTYDLDEASQKQVAKLRELSRQTDDVLKQIKQLYDDYTVYLALKADLVTEEDKETVLQAEREIEGFSKSFLEGSKLPSVIIKLATRLIIKARDLSRIKTNRVIDKYTGILNAVEKEANAKGKTAFDMVAKVDGNNLRLINELSSDFWKNYDAATDSKDKDFFLKNMDKAKYEAVAKEYIDNSIDVISKKQFVTDPAKNELIKQSKIINLKKMFDINDKDFNGYGNYNFKKFFMQALKKDKWYSDDFKTLKTSPNALKLWEFMRELNEKAKAMGYLNEDDKLSFFPLVEASFITKLMQSKNVGKETMDFFKTFYQVQVEEERKFSKLDPETNKVKKTIPAFFTRKGREVTKLSQDMNKVGILWIKALMEYETSKNLENTLHILHKVERAKGSLIVDPESNELVTDARGVPKVDINNTKNADILQTIIDDEIYGLEENENSWGNIQLAQIASKVAQGDEEKQQTVKLNTKKLINTTNTYIQSLALGLKATIAVPNWFGYNFQAYINGGQFYTFSDFTKNNIKSTTGLNFSTVKKGLIDMIVPLNEDLAQEKIRHNAKEQSYTKWLESWNFNDVMMVSMSWPERKLQIANALAFLDNTIVIDGKLVNARKYLAEQDRLVKYNLDQAQRKELESTFDNRLAKLKEGKTVEDLAVIENDRVVLPGVSDEELADLRTQIVEFGRNLNGQMSETNKAAYRRDAIFKSFMMFKNWMPKQISLRALDIHKNAELGSWEYGRTRVLLKTIAHLGVKNILKTRAIITGTDEGLAILREMLEQKKEAYLKKTGKPLTITEEEFFDMMRTALSNQMKELNLLLGMMALVIGAAAMVDDDDDDNDLEKNRLKYFAKIINKTSDEVSFYYNPLTFQSVTNGSLLPALGVTNKAWSVVKNVSKGIYGYSTGDEETLKTTHAAKAFFDMIPILSQFQKEYLPSIDPELAKEMGIRVTAEARQGR
jgi:hypothetical protein